MSGKWIAVLTKRNEEFGAEFNLRQQGFLTWCPWVYVPLKRKARKGRTSVDRREVTVTVRHDKTPQFRRYVFVRLEPGQSVYRINKTRGVSQVVGIGNTPLVVPDSVMDEMQAAAHVDGFVVEPDEVPPQMIEAGDRVKVRTHDSWGNVVADFVAEVLSVDKSGRFRIWSEQFNRTLTIEGARVELLE